jgi:AraC family transcriptional regulator
MARRVVRRATVAVRWRHAPARSVGRVNSPQLIASVDDARRELSHHGALRASSAERGWTGVALDAFASSSLDELIAQPRDHDVLTMALSESPHIMSQQRCGELFEGRFRIGEAIITPAGVESRWRGEFPAHLNIRIERDQLMRLARDMRLQSPRRVEIANSFRVRDPALRSLGEVFSLELHRPDHPVQAVLVESLSIALTAHLLRYYTREGVREATPASAGDLSSIRRTIEYIEDQPEAHLTLSVLARVAGLSRYHFSRVFKQQVGMTPMRYIENARLARAKDLIRSGHVPLAEVSLAVGFADQSHFTRRFHLQEGITPAAYARQHRGG